MKSLKKLSMQFILLLFSTITFAQGPHEKDVFSKKYIKDKMENTRLLWQIQADIRKLPKLIFHNK